MNTLCIFIASVTKIANLLGEILLILKHLIQCDSPSTTTFRDQGGRLVIPFYRFLSLEIYGCELQKADPHKQGATLHHGP